MAFLSTSVRDARMESMRALMDAQDLGALAFSTPDFCYFVSNFEVDVLVWERPVLMVVPLEGTPFAFLNELSTNHIAMARERGTLWVDDVTFYGERPRVEQRLPLVTQWPQAVAAELRARSLDGCAFGLDASTAPLEEALWLLPRCSARVVDTELRELRHVKHPEELDLARAAARLTDWAQERFRAEIHEGRLVEELDWAVGAQVMTEAAGRFPEQSVKLRLLTLTGAESSAPHGFGAGSDSRIAKGDGLVNIVVLRLNGTTVENERTWFCGPPSKEQAEAFDVASRAQAEAVASAVTGSSVSAIDAAALHVFVQAGYERYVLARTGHGMGIGRGAAITAHDFPHDMAFETRPLKGGELYAVEPGIYVPGLGGFRHDDSVIVGDVPEVLTQASKRLEDQIVG